MGWIGAHSPGVAGTPLVAQGVVLIGGRPLPERPLWVRLLTILIVLSAVTPLVKFAYAQLPVLGINRPAKLTAEQTAAALPARLAYRAIDDLRCVEHSRTTDASPGRAGAWDYVCTFVRQPPWNQQRFKVGVRVDHDTITDVSQLYDLEARYIK